VRGYRENELVRDNGYAGSLEYRHPLIRNPQEGKGAGLQLALFGDVGGGWNKGRRDQDDTLASVGLGLLWSHGPVRADLYLAHRLKSRPDKPDHDLQDDGIHFQVTASMD
jgi:hemolysin activation/secretion protein